MENGKPNWWSRPSSAPEAARIPTPPPTGDRAEDATGTHDTDGDFPLPAPQPPTEAPAATGTAAADVTDPAARTGAPDLPDTALDIWLCGGSVIAGELI
ncbi:hypothetical protein AB0B81_28590, partial [Streptomyces sp. NPDC039028]